MSRYIAKNKPDLSQKPEWASYWAQDEDGWCMWYQNMPHCIEADRGQGVWIANGGWSKVDRKMQIDGIGWAHSLVRIDGENLAIMRTER